MTRLTAVQSPASPVTSDGARRAASPAPTPGVDNAAREPARPWWRYGMVWLVVGGPAVVVVASLGTAVVAYRGADEVLVNSPSARVLPVQPTSKTPAMTARNHAATAAVDR